MEFKDLPLLEVGNTRHLAGVLYSGEGQNLLCLFPNEGVVDESQPVENLRMTVPEWEVFFRQTDLQEVEALDRVDGKLAKVVLRKSARVISQGVSWTVFQRDHYRCRYCGKQGGDQGLVLTVDHLVLWEHMGPSIEANLLTACKKCNQTRGNLLYADWLKHPYYKKVSLGLPPAIIEANKEVLGTLASIPLRTQGGQRR